MLLRATRDTAHWRREGPPTHLAQVDLFTIGRYPENCVAGGELLPVAQLTALFRLLGTTFGGDRWHTFATPDVPSPVARFTYLACLLRGLPAGLSSEGTADTVQHAVVTKLRGAHQADR